MWPTMHSDTDGVLPGMDRAMFQVSPSRGSQLAVDLGGGIMSFFISFMPLNKLVLELKLHFKKEYNYDAIG